MLDCLSNSGNYNDDSRTNRIYHPQVIKLQTKQTPTLGGCRPQAMGGHGHYFSNNLSTSSSLNRTPSAPEMPCPPKSCLSRRHHNDTCNNKSLDAQSRKKVIFADDQGYSLTQVKIMSEPSNCPPLWSLKFLEQITQGFVAPHPTSTDTWTVDFKQPASDYLSFRQKIDKNYVSLENVIVKDEDSLVVGTIKVKNVSFEKEVVVRVTFDGWQSQQDIFCNFSRIFNPVGIQTSAHIVYDTFSFKIALPPSPSKKIEFCICFRAGGQEYWDNNDNTNYTIIKRSPFYYQALSPYEKNTSRSNTPTPKFTLGARDSDWHENSPYW
ncbi:PPP1R3B family protein [Megaselia abdita]